MKSSKRPLSNNKVSCDINIMVNRTSPGNEINLHRMTVDEALLELDRYLNHAFVAGLHTVRVVHGKGTGTIRQASIKYMKNHPLVKSLRCAWPDEGGYGVTIADLSN